MGKRQGKLKFSGRKRRFAALQHSVVPGSSPGQLTSQPDQQPTKLHMLHYTAHELTEVDIRTLDEVKHSTERGGVTWLQVNGLADIGLIERLGNLFGIHKLVLEDALDTSHRQKFEDYEDYIFLVVKRGQRSTGFETEHLAMILFPNLLITFHERETDFFAPVLERIRKSTGRIRQYGADYLSYALLDAIVDGYYPILEHYNITLENIENEILSVSDKTIIRRIYDVKSDLMFLHRAAWPLRDISNMLSREDCPFIHETTLHYLRDLHDQTMQVTELSEFYRDIASGLMNTFLAYSGHKMNEIMKMLTMISAIFIPLSFVAAVYGMNFRHMPELNWEYGYPASLGIMLCIGLCMLAIFRRRGWLGRTNIHDKERS